MLRQEDPNGHSVVIAQTTRGRAALIQRLLLYTLVPQLLLLALLAVWLWRGIRSDLRPLVDLQEALDRRDADDLAPVPVVRTSREVEGLGDAVNSLFERLGHSVQAQRQFAGNVAHELRTPLAGIRALADYGLAHPDPAVWREQLERVARSEARASHMVDQLLAIALADEAHATQQRAPVHLAELVEQTVLRHLARADARGVDLGARGIEEGAGVVVQSNAALIEGVLDNLIDNALRYGGRTITVELAGTRAERGRRWPRHSAGGPARPDAALGPGRGRPQAGRGGRARACRSCRAMRGCWARCSRWRTMRSPAACAPASRSRFAGAEIARSIAVSGAALLPGSKSSSSAKSPRSKAAITCFASSTCDAATRSLAPPTATLQSGLACTRLSSATTAGTRAALRQAQSMWASVGVRSRATVTMSPR